VVVIDNLLKDRRLSIARLDQLLRDQRRAAALLVCRSCKAQTAFVFREPRSLKRIPLDQLLPV
jgi:hypothetical protein